MNILFIGNSLTFYHHMPETFRKLAKEADRLCTVDKVTKGGHKLFQFADPKDEYGAILREKAEQKWDCVILQEQSYYPIVYPHAFFDGAKTVCDLFRPVTDRILFYSTFPYEDGHRFYSERVMSRAEMGRRLLDAYTDAANRLGAEVADVGTAFVTATEKKSDICLYEADKKHPSQPGSHLAACVLFSAVYKMPVPKDAFFREEVTPEDAAFLCGVANELFLKK